MNITNITFLYEDIIYDEFDILNSYCSNLDQTFNRLFIILFGIWILFELISIISKNKLNFRETYFNLMIIPFIYYVPKLMIYEGFIDRTGIKRFSYILIGLSIIIIFYLYATGKFKPIIEKIKKWNI